MAKLVKMSMIKFVLKILDQEYFIAIQSSMNLLLITCQNLNQFYLLEIPLDLVEPFNHNEFTIKDSFNFAVEIATYNSSLYMASLDVECLFTNIPLNETINIFVSDLHTKKFYNGKLNKIDLFQFVETSNSKSSFIFDYLIYK